MVQTLKVDLIAETWGRPLEGPWCTATHSVNNVLMVTVGGISWD